MALLNNIDLDDELQIISQDYELKIIDSKNLLTLTKFEYYFLEKETEKNTFNNTYDETFLRRKRSSKGKKRRKNLDNIIKKIKTRFFNTVLIKKLNEKLKAIGSGLNLEKFPKNFVSDINHQRNNQLLNMTLKEIFEKKELYKENELEKYCNNLKVIENEDIKENTELKKILNKKYYEVFEEYVNSEEFQVKEIERLKEKKMTDDYIQKYINVAKHYVEYFSK